MSVLFLTLAIVTAPIKDPLAPYRGLPVLDVELDMPAGEVAADLEELVAIERGYLLDTASVQQALKRLYSLGRFADVAVHATRRTGTVVLHFTLKPVQRLSSLDLDGIEHADADALKAALGLKEGDEVDRRTKGRLEARALSHLTHNGFPEAKVEVFELPRDDQSIAYRVIVVEGSPRRVGELGFSGSPRLPEALLRELILTRERGVLRADELAEDVRRLREAYYARGFWRARIGTPEISGRDLRPKVTFPIEAGERVALYFKGNQVLTDTELRALVPRPEAPIQEDDLQVVARRIEERYRRAGYFHAKVELRGYRDAKAGALRYVYTIAEGEPLRVVALRFEGATVFTPEVLDLQIRSSLKQELVPVRTFEPLEDGVVERGHFDDEPRAPPSVPPEERWLPEVYERVLGDVTTAYRSQGYLSATVGPPEVQMSRGKVSVRVPVVEGPQTRIRSITFRGNQAFDAPTLLAELEAAADREGQLASLGSTALARPGAPYSSAGVEDARIHILRSYRDRGYIYARLFSDVALSADAAHADVVYRFEEGPQVRVQNVLIRGNRYTRDTIIESRMSLRAGDVYSVAQALQDQRSIAALDVFSSVRVKLIDEEIPAERKDVVAEVVERNRGKLGLAGGLSTADGVRVLADYMQLNLFGSAASFNLSLKVNWQVFFSFYGTYADRLEDRYAEFTPFERTEIEARAGIRSPRILTWPFDPSFRFDLVYERDNALPYSLEATRAIFGADFSPARRVSFGIEPQLSVTDLQCWSLTDTATDDERRRACQDDFTSRRQAASFDEGRRVTLTIGPSLTLDGRDDPFTPTRGVYFNARVFWAPYTVVPEDEDLSDFDTYTKAEGTLAAYLPLPKRMVLALTARAGAVVAPLVALQEGAEVLPENERYRLGGATTMRGFYNESMYPEDFCVGRAGRTVCDGLYESTLEQATPGGNLFTLFKTELRVPMSESFSLGFFTDLGNLWIKAPPPELFTLRLSTGLGLRYGTPFGPIGLDVGFNPYPRQRVGETAVEWHFALGY